MEYDMSQPTSEIRPSWMKGFIPHLDGRNPRANDKPVLSALQRAEVARQRYLAACDRVQELLSATH